MANQTHFAEVAYPPAPWEFVGQAWVGLFRADRPVPVPAPWQPLLGARTLVVALVRYREGTLRYDELITGAFVRRGLHIGLWVDRIWVDSVPSLWGGRRIWGLPKQLAQFAWNGNTVHIDGDAGLIAAIDLDRRGAVLPPLPAVAPGVGRRDGAWTLFAARGWAAPGNAHMRINAWSPRFPYQPQPTPLMSIKINPFRMSIGEPVLWKAEE